MLQAGGLDACVSRIPTPPISILLVVPLVAPLVVLLVVLPSTQISTRVRMVRTLSAKEAETTSSATRR